MKLISDEDKLERDLICMLVFANNELNSLTIKDISFLSQYLRNKLKERYFVTRRFEI